MSHEKMIREYYRILELHDYNSLMTLFSPDAIIVHPIFGNMPATEFFKILLDRARSHKITIHNIFQALEQPDRLAAYLRAVFVTKNGTTFDEDGVHIYDFSADGQIIRLTVVIDTYPFRGQYAEGQTDKP